MTSRDPHRHGLRSRVHHADTDRRGLSRREGDRIRGHRNGERSASRRRFPRRERRDRSHYEKYQDRGYADEIAETTSKNELVPEHGPL